MTTPDDGFRLEFTGEAVLVVGLKGYEPMSFRIDDLTIAKALVRCLIDLGATEMPVGTQTKAETKRLRQILKGIP